MGVYKKGSSWWIDVYVEGRRIRKKIGPEKKTAELAAKEIATQAARGRWIGGIGVERVTFADFFLKKYFPRKSASIAGPTIRNYDVYFRKHYQPHFGHLYLDRIQSEHVEDYVAGRRGAGAAESTINTELAQIRAVLNAAVRWGYIHESPGKAVKNLRTPESEIRAMTEEQVEQLLAHIDRGAWLWTFVQVGIHAGLRSKEILNLTWGDVDFTRRALTVKNDPERQYITKSKGNREIPMNDDLFDALAYHARVKKLDSPFVFPGIYGSKPHINAETARTTFNAALDAAGLERVRIHDLRHTLRIRQAQELGKLPGLIPKFFASLSYFF